jgi:hypothetical protein
VSRTENFIRALIVGTVAVAGAGVLTGCARHDAAAPKETAVTPETSASATTDNLPEVVIVASRAERTI